LRHLRPDGTDRNGGCSDSSAHQGGGTEAQRGRKFPVVPSLDHTFGYGDPLLHHRKFDFGIDYVFKAFAPMHKKMNADTWFHAEECLFELLRSMALRQYTIPDLMCDKILAFLDNVDKNAKKVNSIIDLTVAAEEARETQTMSFEARVIKAMLLNMFQF
jgi:hypothetical protein